MDLIDIKGCVADMIGRTKSQTPGILHQEDIDVIGPSIKIEMMLVPCDCQLPSKPVSDRVLVEAAMISSDAVVGIWMMMTDREEFERSALLRISVVVDGNALGSDNLPIDHFVDLGRHFWEYDVASATEPRILKGLAQACLGRAVPLTFLNRNTIVKYSALLHQ